MGLDRITVGVDGSDCSLVALRWADTLAGRSNAQLVVVMTWHFPYVVTTPGVVAAVPPAAEMAAVAEESLADLLSSHPVRSPVESVVFQGTPAAGLVDVSAGSDLLVVGRRGVGGLRALGSTSRHCALHALCSVAVITDNVQPVPDRPAIAVAVDGSDRSIDALVWAIEAFDDAEISAIYSHDESVFDGPDVAAPVRARLDERAWRVVDDVIAAAVERTGTGVEVTGIAVARDPRTTVIDTAADTDVLVVGDRGHSGLAGLLLGSFATYAVSHASDYVPVIVARRPPL